MGYSPWCCEELDMTLGDFHSLKINGYLPVKISIFAEWQSSEWRPILGCKFSVFVFFCSAL